MPEQNKPVISRLEQVNALRLIHFVVQALLKAGLPDQAAAFKQKAFDCGSYKELLQVVQTYVEVK